MPSNGDESKPVLLIEPDAASRTGLQKILEAERYAVIAFATGADALVSLRTGVTPCLIIFVLSPNDDGGAFRTEQARDPRFSMVPIVLYTGDDGTGPHPVGKRRAPLMAALLALVGRHCNPVSDDGRS